MFGLNRRKPYSIGGLLYCFNNESSSNNRSGGIKTFSNNVRRCSQKFFNKAYCYTNEIVFDRSELDRNIPVLENLVVETTVGGISFEDDCIPFIDVIEIAGFGELGS